MEQSEIITGELQGIIGESADVQEESTEIMNQPENMRRGHG